MTEIIFYSLIGVALFICMVMNPKILGPLLRYGKYIEIVSHGVVGIYCYYVLTKDGVVLFLIFAWIELIQWMFCKRKFCYRDIGYSMFAVSIVYIIDKFI